MVSGKANGAVAAGHTLTAEAARGILEDGGNAFDAVLGAALAACLCEPVFASLGGGGYLLARPAHAKPWFYDFFAHTPRTRLADDKQDWHQLQAAGMPPMWGGLGTIATPGMVAGVFAIHQDLGRMPVRDMAARALAWAIEGVEVDAFQARMLAMVAPSLTLSEDSAAMFTVQEPATTAPDGAPLAGLRRPLLAGERIKSWHFADALEALVLEGPDLFYKGEIGGRLIADCQRDGGHLRREDLLRYQVESRAPLECSYAGQQVWISPPPSLGGLQLAFSLALLDGSQRRSPGWGSPHHWGTLAEAFALTSEAALEEASPFADQYDRSLLAEPTVALYRERLQNRPTARRGTTHVSVIDRAGNVAALTLSNGEGSGYVIPRTGIMMNNMLGVMDLMPDGIGQWQRNSRMATLFAPTLIRHRDGREMALGAGGSSRIRTALAQVLCNLLDYDLPLEEAITRPRLHVEGSGDDARFGCERDMPDDLRDRWRTPCVWDDLHMYFGGVHAVERNGRGVLTAVGDPRRNGAEALV